MRVRALAFCVLIPAAAAADEVLLRGGGRMSGVVVSRDASRVVLDVGAGRIGIPMSRVERIVTSRSALAAFRERAARLGVSDIDGWLALARWARQNDLGAQARDAYEHVLEQEPANGVANAALGRVRLGERWVSADDANRARGLVQFEGLWMTPAEKGALLAERAAEADGRRALNEATARVREAEARARAAEAAARRAEAEATGAGQPVQVGVPLYPPFGGAYGGSYGGPYGGPYGGSYPPIGVYDPYRGGRYEPAYEPRPRPRSRRDPPAVVIVVPLPSPLPHPPPPAVRSRGAHADIPAR